MRLGIGIDLTSLGGAPSPPNPTSISPALGDPLGGSYVSILGTGMANVSAVSIGGSSATIIDSTSGQVNVLTPALSAATGYDVVVTSAAGSKTLAASYESWSPLQLSN